MSKQKRTRPRKRSARPPRRLYPWMPVPGQLALLRSPSQLAEELVGEPAVSVGSDSADSVCQVSALDRAPEAEHGPEAAGTKRLQRLLNKAEREPSSVLDDGRCLSPRFLTRFFDLCDGKALEQPKAAPAYARAALELAAKTGEDHWRNLARGVAVHARIANSRWPAAAGLLDEYRASAFGCCQVCVSDWLRRQGDLLVESEDPARARAFLEMSAQVPGRDLDDDARGRILFVRGIAWFFQGRRDRALGDAGGALALLSLDRSRSYFPDAVSFVAVFLLRGAERSHVELALELLSRLRRRLKASKGFRDVLVRVRWVEGQLHCLLGHQQRARKRLESALGAMRRSAPHRWVLAAATDLALVYTRHLHEGNVRTIGTLLRRCQRELRLREELHRRLDRAVEDFETAPRQVLAGLRESFVAPVPGLLAEEGRGARWSFEDTASPSRPPS